MNSKFVMDRIIQGTPVTTSGRAITHLNDPATLIQILGGLTMENVRKAAERAKNLSEIGWGVHQWTSAAEEIDQKFGKGGVLAALCWSIAEVWAEVGARRFGTNLLEAPAATVMAKHLTSCDEGRPPLSLPVCREGSGATLHVRSPDAR